MNYLITGATGNVGKYVLEQLGSQNVFAGISSEKSLKRMGKGIQYRIIRFGDEKTYETALKDMDCVFLMRPPNISNIKRDILPFLKRMKEMAVNHVVFLSLAGADKNKFVPHYKIEQYIMDLGINYTFLRPTFFMQNLSTTHLNEIQTKREIIVPAGKGKTNFIDVRDIASAAASVIGKEAYYNKAYTITGEKSYTYYEIADIMSELLKKKIQYNNPSVIRFFSEMRRKKYPVAFIIVMIGIYYTTKLGKADINTDDLEKLIGRKPISFNQFVLDNANIFLSQSNG